MKINGVDVQSPLVSGVSIKTLNSQPLPTSGNYDVPSFGRMKICNIIPSTGIQVIATTLNTVTYSILIRANTFSSNGILNFACRLGKSGGTTSTWNTRVYKNTSNSLTGAVQIASIVNGAGGTTFIQGIRYFRLEAGNMLFYPVTFQATSDIISGTNAESSTTFALNVDNYILIAIQKSVANAEICQGLFSKLVGYE